MYDHYPPGCSSADITASDPFDDPCDEEEDEDVSARIGICAYCTDNCYENEGCLVLPNGVLCSYCLDTLPQEELLLWLGAIAPFDWDEEQIRKFASFL